MTKTTGMNMKELFAFLVSKLMTEESRPTEVDCSVSQHLDADKKLLYSENKVYSTEGILVETGGRIRLRASEDSGMTRISAISNSPFQSMSFSFLLPNEDVTADRLEKMIDAQMKNGKTQMEQSSMHSAWVRGKVHASIKLA